MDERHNSQRWTHLVFLAIRRRGVYRSSAILSSVGPVHVPTLGAVDNHEAVRIGIGKLVVAVGAVAGGGLVGTHVGGDVVEILHFTLEQMVTQFV